MKFTLEIECDNAAFEGDPNEEIARILRDLVDDLEARPAARGTFPLRDSNGNRVGAGVFRE